MLARGADLLEGLELRLGAELQSSDPTGVRVRYPDVAIALIECDVPYFRATAWQAVDGPLRGFRIEFGHRVVAAHIRVDHVVLVDDRGVRVHALERQLVIGRLHRLDIDLREVAAPPVSDPDHIAVLVRSHAAR